MGTITKALNLLNFYSETVSELGLMEFKNLSGQDKATVYRHLVELEQNGFLEQDPVNKKYRLGSTILRLANIREKAFPIRRILSQWVDQLSAEIGELVHCSIIQKTEMSPICFRDASNAATRVNFSLAEMLPLHATSSGLAALAFGPPDLIDSLESKKLNRFTANTATDIKSLRKLVSEIRHTGYVHTSETYEKDVSSFAVPFYQGGPHAYGTVAIAIPASRIDLNRTQEFVEALWKTAGSISRELGGEIPNNLKTLWRLAA